MKPVPTVLLSALCLAAGIARAQPPSRSEPGADRPFVDVPRDHWAYEAVEELRKRGILRGYPAVSPPAPALRGGTRHPAPELKAAPRPAKGAGRRPKPGRRRKSVPR